MKQPDADEADDEEDGKSLESISEDEQNLFSEEELKRWICKRCLAVFPNQELLIEHLNKCSDTKEGVNQDEGNVENPEGNDDGMEEAEAHEMEYADADTECIEEGDLLFLLNV